MGKHSGEEPWDDYCVAAAASMLLHQAARLTMEAATLRFQGEVVVQRRAMIAKVLGHLSSARKTPEQIEDSWREDAFRRFLAQCFALDTKDVSAAVERVRFDARKLRGQLDMFESDGQDPLGVDAFIREQLTDMAGKLVLTSVRNEMADYFVIVGEVGKVYMHVTGGKVSMANTRAEDVIAMADDYMNDCVEEAIKRMTVADLKARIAEIEAPKEAEPPCDE